MTKVDQRCNKHIDTSIANNVLLYEGVKLPIS